MKMLWTFIPVFMCAVLCTFLSACSKEPVPTETAPPVNETDPTPAETTAPEDLGTLNIEDVYAWIGYPNATVFPVFSNEDYKEALAYEYDETALTIDADTNSVTALKKGVHSVTAKSEHFSTTFKVRIEEVDKMSQKFSAKDFASAAEQRKKIWEENGVDGETTIFIGDSFFDTAFWTGFYTAEYVGKDALCLGISATTTYDWEEWVTGWLSETKPKSIVMHVGTNNVYDDGDTVNAAISAYRRLFTVMHEQFPETHIYWFGVTQRSYDSLKIGYVERINKSMRLWCDSLDFITYIDTPSLITNDMLKDTVHPKPENYKIFVEELAKTGIVIGDAAKAPVDTSDKIDDISFAKNQTIAAGTALSTIKYKGNALTSNYVVSGKIDIMGTGSNPHIQFGILDSGNNRILLWDNETKGAFKLCIPYDTNVPAEDIYTFKSGETTTIEWKLVCHNDYVYFYIGGELKLVYTAINNVAKVPLTLGSESVDCRFYDMQAITLSDDQAEYESAIAEMNDTITKYSQYKSYERLRVD